MHQSPLLSLFSGWYDLSVAIDAWKALIAAAEAMPRIPETLRYDLVNLGREALSSPEWSVLRERGDFFWVTIDGNGSRASILQVPSL